MPQSLKALLQRLIAVLGSGAIFLFFSEFFFVNEAPVKELISVARENPLAALLGLVEFSVFYAFFAYSFLIMVGSFRVQSLWMLFLAGSLLGWIIEGVIIPAVYESVPFSFAWTAIGWHAIIDLMLGWYLVRKVLERNNLFYTLLLAITLGLFWAYFATWFWNGEEGILPRILPENFTLFVFVASVPWLAGTIAVSKWGGSRFRASKLEIVLVAGATIVMAALMAVPFLPLSALLLPIVAVTFFALWYAKPALPSEDALALVKGNTIKWIQFPILLFTPLTASLTYPIYFGTGQGLIVQWVALPLAFAGIILYFIALFKAFRMKTPANAPT